MSFKRDGDDENLLKNLNHQRVRELLGSHIPQDEAKLLSNGRLTCTICCYRPIFDTINMLAVHRKGKRHLLELSKYIKCKDDSEMRALKKHLMSEELLTGEKSEKMARLNLPPILTRNAVLGAKHAVAKQSALRHQRKPVLEIQSVISTSVLVKPTEFEARPTKTKSATASVRHYLKSISRKSSLEQVVEKNRENYGADLKKNSRCEESASSSPQRAATSAETDTAKVKSRDNDYEMKLRMSGWIKDSLGNWTKDPNVEFDSDEEELPPPPSNLVVKL